MDAICFCNNSLSMNLNGYIIAVEDGSIRVLESGGDNDYTNKFWDWPRPPRTAKDLLTIMQNVDRAPAYKPSN